MQGLWHSPIDGGPPTSDMTEPIGFQRVRQLVDAGAQLVEVLPRGEYEEQHLPGAINIPLKKLDADVVAVLNNETPVIVYCWDSI